MKKFIRLLIKIPATLFVVIFFLLSYLIFTIIAFFEWVYESPEWNIKTTYECRDEIIRILKNWFTTV